MKEHNYYVYMMASKSGVLYLGMTNNLERRVMEHRNGTIDGFTKKYSCNKLVYFEHTTDVNASIEREKQIKKWRREKKLNLINQINPSWNDLSLEYVLI